ncbi:MAG: outer membrane beta-barrel protein [Saprospiraceae bacterium]|nr:outer membrane beta-barrel protein [Saprospiraceae bacterium]
MIKPIPNLLLLLVCFVSCHLSAQSNAWPATIKLKDGQILQGEIVYGDDAESLSFKDVNGKERTYMPEELEVFTVTMPRSKPAAYVSRLTVYDTSPQSSVSLTENANPDYKTKHLFLLVLLEGETSLYKYVDKTNRSHFYLEKKGQPIEYLLYKKFLVYGKSGKKVVENKQYLFTLNQNMQNCPDVAVKSPKYAQDQLYSLVEDYLKCTGKPIVNSYVADPKRWNFSVAAGANINFLQINNANPWANVPLSLDPSFGPALGLRVERTLIKPKRKTSLGADLNLRFFKYAWNGSSTVNDSTTFSYSSELEASYLNLDGFFKHTLIKNSEAQLYVIGAAGFGFRLTNNYSEDQVFIQNGWIDRETEEKGVLFYNQLNIGGGMGVQWDRFGLEGRFRWSNGIFNEQDGYSTKESGVQILITYRLTN